MDIQVLLTALRKLREDNPNHIYLLMLDYEIDDRPVAIFEVRIKHFVDGKQRESRMRFVVKGGDNITPKAIVETFTDKLYKNMKELYS